MVENIILKKKISRSNLLRGCTFSANNQHKIFEKQLKYSKILLFLKKKLRVKNAKKCLKDAIFTRNQIIIYFYK